MLFNEATCLLEKVVECILHQVSISIDHYLVSKPYNLTIVSSLDSIQGLEIVGMDKFSILLNLLSWSNQDALWKWLSDWCYFWRSIYSNSSSWLREIGNLWSKCLWFSSEFHLDGCIYLQEELVGKVLEFLEKPHKTTDVLLEEKEQVTSSPLPVK